MADIDTNLYSRQIGTFGMEMMGKLIQLKVLISGLRGVGVETAKNLILAGPNTVVVHDDSLVALSDLGSNFYLTQSDVGARSRAEASVDKLQELNPHVRVSTHKGSLTNDFLIQFDVIFLSESDLNTLERVNDFCRNNGQKRIGFISCEAWGAAGYGFVDFGHEFKSFDKDGENNRSFIISNITKANPGIVTVHEEKRHTYQDGDWVVFKEVQGMSEINNLQPMEVKFVSPFSFSIGDTSAFSDYTREGIVEQVKVPTNFNFRSLRESLVNPATNEHPLNITDFGKFGRAEQLHIVFWAVREFQRKHGNLPALHNDQHAQEVFAIANEINARQKELGHFNVEAVEESVVRYVSRFARAQVSPVASFWGGIMAQEIVKFTGKYTPIQQWLHIDFFEIIPDSADWSPRNSRYDDQIAIIGNEIHNKISSSRSFLVGAGALGCEFLKLYALMGVSVNGGEVVVTDDDSIEISNLNRQFLFRRDDVGHSKSERAALAAQRMNSDINVISKQDRVSPENEHIFHDDFWHSRGFVTNAVDNVNARLYVDSRCVWYERPLLESGTLGTKANTQVCLPHKTQSYGDSQDPPEESIPMCTLKNFPHAIEHCIEWAKDEFHGAFSDTPQEVNKYFENPTVYLASLGSAGNSTVQKDKLQKIKTFIALLKNASFEECVKVARESLQESFHNQIAQLLHNFPLDYTTKDGTPFWSGPKRAPTPAHFDVNDAVHLEYIVAGANLMAYILGVPQNRNVEQIKEIVSRVHVKPFAPKVIAIQTEENQAVQNLGEDEQILSALLQEMKVADPAVAGRRVNPVVFEKDDDSNFHIDFITQAANLRARNYKIPEADRQKTKMIAGKIIPAIATTTAMIAGAVAIELYKLHLHDNVEKFKNTFANLGISTILFSEPLPPMRTKSKDYDPIVMGPVKAYPEGFSTWEKLTVAGPCTLQQFIDAILREHKLKTNIVSCGKTCLYNGYLPKGKHADRLGKSLHLLFEEVSGLKIIPGRRYLAVEVSCEGEEDGSDYAIPVIKYTF
jgi:ubiquitin-activating enzyme E1